MAETPYEAPTATLVDQQALVAQSIRRDIRNGWIAGVISGTVTVTAVVLSALWFSMRGFSPLALVDAAVVFALAYGIYRRSRVCAILLLCYFIVSKLFLITVDKTAFVAIPLAIVFTYFYARAAIGTFRYHKRAKA
jgi:hypothetical protein